MEKEITQKERKEIQKQERKASIQLEVSMREIQSRICGQFRQLHVDPVVPCL